MSLKLATIRIGGREKEEGGNEQILMKGRNHVLLRFEPQTCVIESDREIDNSFIVNFSFRTLLLHNR